MRGVKKAIACVVSVLALFSMYVMGECIYVCQNENNIDTKRGDVGLPLDSTAGLIAEKSIPLPELSGTYDGIAYSDSGEQLMIWGRDGNVRIYDFVNEKLVLKSEASCAVNQEIFWQPDGMSTESSENKCVWFPSLSFYRPLIMTAYNPPPSFSELGSFLNKCRRINPYASEIVEQYCKGLEYNDFSGVSAMAYDDQRRLTPLISHYNEPWPQNMPETGVSSSLLGESLDMKTLACFYEPLAGHSEERWQKIVFYRHLKPWREYSLSDFGAIACKYQMAPCSVSSHGNLACLVLYRFPSYGRHIGSYGWFKSGFQSHRKDVVIIVLDMQNNSIILKEEISGSSGVEDQLVWRVAFCESKREFAMLNAKTGIIKIYRY